MPLIGGFRSMKVEVDVVYQAAAPAAHAALYNVTDYSGSGVLKRVSQLNPSGAEYCYLTITIDGGTAEAINADGVTGQKELMYGYFSNDVSLDLYAEFNSALLVKIANDHASNTANISGLCAYAHLSEEISREIIPAGQPLPDRDHTYPFDVLVVRYATGGSSIKFLSSEMPRTWFDAQGRLQGKLVKPKYNPVAIGQAGIDYETGSPKFVYEDAVEDKVVDVVLTDMDGYPGSKVFSVPIVKGVIDSQYLPVKPSAIKVDATKIISIA
ncbi:MAG TPA: hypothetical protein PKL48_02630 [Thermodesulfobacteriota bacterium]|nr:hypothetical protein [Thermodesulfobacteriota bacterium]